MSNLNYMASIIMLSILCLTTAESVLRCWRCSTDVSNGDFCHDPFEPNGISDQLRYWSYVNCTYSAGVKSVNTRPVCKKVVLEVYGKHVITRSCFYEDIDDPADKCARDTTSSHIKTLFCETCNTDGCNGASSLTAYLALIITSLCFVLKLIK